MLLQVFFTHVNHNVNKTDISTELDKNANFTSPVVAKIDLLHLLSPI